ncbi:septation protein A [Rhodoligotrophos defluvii]|uniref:septation protein A n=1 Tax=Rhodoligotrophos defluvii TaxID=2561934 RepID=UPI0010C9A715|nr:septation protein A [Rhodoligotrophos defluvii]
MSEKLEPAGRGDRALGPVLKLTVELGPLLAFFLVNARAGIFAATFAYMVATVAALAVTWFLVRRLPIMPLVTGVFVVAFGGLTLLLQDELFIKMKPTIVNALFGMILIGGLAFGKSLLKPVLGEALMLEDAGWDKLTFRWALFFLFLAALNEIVWRNFSTQFWVSFKVFGVMPLTLLFAAMQLPVIRTYLIDQKNSENGDR